MAITPKLIYASELPSTIGDLVTVSTVSVVHNIILHNTTATTRTVILGPSHSSTYRQMYKLDLPAYDSVQISLPGEGLVLAVGDKLRGNADTTGVNIFTYGSEVT